MPLIGLQMNNAANTLAHQGHPWMAIGFLLAYSAIAFAGGAVLCWRWWKGY